MLVYLSMQVFEFDPCSDEYVEAYLNLAEVQAALHVKPTQWTACGYTNIYTRQKWHIYIYFWIYAPHNIGIV